MSEKFPLISLEGSPGEIGLKHGKILKKRIEKTIAFYRKIFKKTKEEIFFAATHFKDCIRSFNKDYYTEIEGIAAGSGVDPLWIYALNSRTEILNTLENECTAFYLPTSGVLSQNWDWAEDMEHLAVIMKITRPDGHKILQITEPGIIGKIGFNSAQIGVTLNFLHINQKLDGVPIHIILRTLLDAKSIDEGMRKINGNTSGKSSNIIFALHIRHKPEFFSKKNKKSSTKTQKSKFILAFRLAQIRHPKVTDALFLQRQTRLM